MKVIMLKKRPAAELVDEMLGILEKEGMDLNDKIVLIALANALRGKVGEWIPIDEGMPEERDTVFARFKGTPRWDKHMWEKASDKVIVTVEYEDGTKGTEYASTKDGKWKFTDDVIKRKVLAWMPKPDPYKGEQNEAK